MVASFSPLSQVLFCLQVCRGGHLPYAYVRSVSVSLRKGTLPSARKKKGPTIFAIAKTCIARLT